jgi:hypothetical protein
MSNKLTAKLSDGREYEVLSGDDIANHPDRIWLSVKPIKREPPKKVWVNVHRDGEKFFYEQFADSRANARTATYDATYCYRLMGDEKAAEEKREPREWWQIVDNESLGNLSPIAFATLWVAEDYYAANRHALPPQARIIKVREVIE